MKIHFNGDIIHLISAYKSRCGIDKVKEDFDFDLKNNSNKIALEVSNKNLHNMDV